MSEIADKVARIIVEHFGGRIEDIRLEDSFYEDFGADSHELLELAMDMEDAFDMEISDSDIRAIRTVGDAVAYIEAHSGSAR